jgi:hypothetical protein
MRKDIIGKSTESGQSTAVCLNSQRDIERSDEEREIFKDKDQGRRRRSIERGSYSDHE